MSTRGELKDLISNLRDLADKIERAVNEGTLKVTEHTYIEMYDGDNGNLIKKTQMSVLDPTPKNIENSKKAMIQNNIRSYVIRHCPPEGGWESLEEDKWLYVRRVCKEKIKNLQWKVYEGDQNETKAD